MNFRATFPKKVSLNDALFQSQDDEEETEQEFNVAEEAREESHEASSNETQSLISMD